MKNKKWVDYKEYLTSEVWKKKRNKIIKERGECELCGEKKRLEVHHLRYRYKSGKSILGRERETDLVVLCWYCHNRLHEVYGRGASFGKEEIEKFKNGRDLICLTDGTIIPVSKFVYPYIKEDIEKDNGLIFELGEIKFLYSAIVCIVDEEVYKDLVVYKNKLLKK